MKRTQFKLEFDQSSSIDLLAWTLLHYRKREEKELIYYYCSFADWSLIKSWNILNTQWHRIERMKGAKQELSIFGSMDNIYSLTSKSLEWIKNAKWILCIFDLRLFETLQMLFVWKEANEKKTTKKHNRLN